MTFSIAKLHADDQAWLKVNHPPTEKEKGVKKTAAAVPRGAAAAGLRALHSPRPQRAPGDTAARATAATRRYLHG